MVQFYFLAVLFNILGGLVLSAGYLKDKFSPVGKLRESVDENASFRMILIIGMAVVGLFKILSVTEGDVPIVGDLLPALSLLFMSFIMGLEHYKARSDVSTPQMDRLEGIFLKNSAIFGLGAIVIAVLHFLFPRVLFL